jgi:hypothetical protein
MEFSHKKLPREASENFKNTPIREVKPHTLVFAPAYVFMKLNEKFVAVKGPLDFFLPEELARLSSFDSLFFPKIIEVIEDYFSAGRRIRKILSAEKVQGQLSATPFELSDAVLRVLGPLWGPTQNENVAIEPLFVAALVSKLCDPLDSDDLLRARERGIDSFERAIELASWSVFFALHLGHCDLNFLNRLYFESFDCFARSLDPGAVMSGECKELCDLALATEACPLRSPHAALNSAFLNVNGSADDRVIFGNRTTQKLSSRLSRIMRDFGTPDLPVASVFGKGGFVDG